MSSSQDLSGGRDSNGHVVVTVWFDYTCPHSHIGLGRLNSLSAELAFAIDRRPFLLRPDVPVNGVLGQDRPAEGQRPAGDIPGPRPPLALPGEKPPMEPFSSRSLSTVLIHEATASAREQGRDGEFYLEVAREYWDRGADLGCLYTLRRFAVKAGLDWGAMWPEIESSHHRQWVMEEHRAAVERGVKGVPSYLIGGSMYTGDVSLDVLREAIKEAGA